LIRQRAIALAIASALPLGATRCAPAAVGNANEQARHTEAGNSARSTVSVHPLQEPADARAEHESSPDASDIENRGEDAGVRTEPTILDRNRRPVPAAYADLLPFFNLLADSDRGNFTRRSWTQRSSVNTFEKRDSNTSTHARG
jgi:hypothetical protein